MIRRKKAYVTLGENARELRKLAKVSRSCIGIITVRWNPMVPFERDK